ncbi:MAG TPA: TolC family protein [Gammaproteobacteria bacterium]
MHKRFLWAAAAMLAGPPLQAQAPIAAERIAPVDAPALAGLVAAALAEHPAVLAAEAGLDREQALARAAARPLFNPEIELDYESAATDDTALRLTQTLDFAGRRSARTRVAERRIDATAQRVAVSRRDLALEVLTALGAYWTADGLVQLATRRSELLERVADVAAQRARLGDAPRSDLNLANLARAQARMERARAAADLAEAEAALQALVADPPAAWPLLPVTLPEVDLAPGELASLVAEVPDVELLEETSAVAAAEVRLRERERRPSPSVSVVGGEEDDESMLGIGFSIPLNVRNRFVHEVEAARADARRAEREVDDVTIRALAAARSATARYELVNDAWSEWTGSGAVSLTQQTELLERLWRAGELTLTDYLVQLNQTLETRRSALELRQELWDAWFAWLASTGQIGDWLGLPVESIRGDAGAGPVPNR